MSLTTATPATTATPSECPVISVCVHLAEPWFNTLQRRCLRRSDFASADVLQAQMTSFIHTCNRLDAHPFRWTYTGDPLAA
jgi:hypothetical protein